jgi:hypothetical protein
VTLEGELLGNIVAIGAETTGWAIEQAQADASVVRTEIDCVLVAKQAAALEGQRVRAWGKWEERRYVERGVVRVLVVEGMEGVE